MQVAGKSRRGLASVTGRGDPFSSKMESPRTSCIDGCLRNPKDSRLEPLSPDNKKTRTLWGSNVDP